MASKYDPDHEALIEGFITMNDTQALRGEENDQLNVSLNNKIHVKQDDDEIKLNVADDLDGSGNGGGGGAGAVKENVSIYKAGFHIFKGNVGTGVFLIPTFFKDSGYILSSVFMIVVGLIVMDCSLLLVFMKRMINRRNVASYSQLADFVYGAVGRYVLMVALLLTQFGFCLMYVQLFATTMEGIVPEFKAQTYVWIVVIIVIVTPITFFSDNLSILAICSILATVCVFFCLISTFVISCLKIKNEGINPTAHPIGHSIPLGWFNNIANDMMVLEGIGIVLPVENSCTQKRLVPRMIIIVLGTVITWYTVFGIVGYLAYGHDNKSSLVFVMPSGPFYTVVRVAFMINILCTYPILFMPAMQQIDMMFNMRPRSLLGMGVRVLINLVVLGLAMAIGPDAVDTVVAFIGALPATVIIMILPPLLRLIIEYSVQNAEDVRMSKAYLKHVFTGPPVCSIARARCYVYMVLGVLIMVIGTLAIVLGLVNPDEDI